MNMNFTCCTPHIELDQVAEGACLKSGLQGDDQRGDKRQGQRGRGRREGGRRERRTRQPGRNA